MPSSRGIAASNASSTGEAWITLLEISHPDLSAPIYVCDNGEDVVSNGITYIALPFDLQLPDDDDASGAPVARLLMDDVGEFTVDGNPETITNILNSVTSAPDVVVSIVLASQPDTIEFGPMDMTLRHALTQNHQQQGDLYFEDLLNEPYPGDTFNPATHPGLF